MIFDESDPYYVPYDIFDDVERVEELVEKLLELDHREFISTELSTNSSMPTHKLLSWNLDPREEDHIHGRRQQNPRAHPNNRIP